MFLCITDLLKSSRFTKIFIGFHSPEQFVAILCVLGCSRVLILFLFLTLFSPYFSPCLRGEYWVLVVVRYTVLKVLAHRSFNRNTNFNPDHTSSTAHTFTSTKPFFSPISRATFSFKLVLILEAPFGHEIQRAPFIARLFFSRGNADSSSSLSVVKN